MEWLVVGWVKNLDDMIDVFYLNSEEEEEEKKVKQIKKK